MNSYKNYLLSQNGVIKEDLLQLVRSQSPSHNKLLVDQCGELLKEIFHNRLTGSWKPEVFEQQQTGNHFSFELEDSGSKPRILLLSHFDTVWDVDAIPLVEKDNDIYGPGVFDMKAGLLSSIWAIRSLQSELQELPFTPVFLFTADEEIGSKTSRAIIEQVAATCDSVLVMEPPVFGSNALKTERKGVGRYILKVQGISAHAGNHHEDGVSAILELSRQIIELEKLTDYEKETTLNVGVIRGGTSSNVISSSAEAEIDFRVTSYAEAEKIIRTLENLKPFNSVATLSITGELNRPPLEKTEANSLLYQQAVTAGARVGIEVKEAKAGGGSDGNFTSALGIPTLDGLGIPGDGPHAIHEHIHFDHFSERCALISEICLEIGKKETK
ncbi:Peptidase M20/M25/M40 family protein [Planococcus antarcticus DSM 14505]|uniref:Peptidase M20 n=2 Tax=Planococcus TaxID=1372 RepID=A0A1C7DEI2_9BACL|nr:peptidase M20 [Planococcus antarcticus DSM 14505]EIM07527.1 Peptidase M20/M25/M40 family protein [Planococcus antarcticus DSM 14505]